MYMTPDTEWFFVLFSFQWCAWFLWNIFAQRDYVHVLQKVHVKIKNGQNSGGTCTSLRQQGSDLGLEDFDRGRGGHFCW